MSRDIWSILPQPGDMVAEVRTRRFRTLTYARAQSEAEDVTFFSRERKRNIAIYASPQKLASRGEFYNEDDLPSTTSSTTTSTSTSPPTASG